MTSPLRPEDPARVGDYELTARIGKGGQGVVYLGQGPDGVRVAVKVMESSWASDARARSRFAKEIETASKVAPFCTATLLDADIDAEPPYIVSEYIEGPSLREAVLREGPRTGAALDRLAISTATALVAIHQAGVVHRDFKPANVLLGPDGPRVIDFGIARSTEATVTATNSIVGTPAYMAPEQVEGRELTSAVDIFAWAGVMVFAATGESPFHDETLPAIIHRVLNRPPRLDGVDERLRPLLESCLAKEPEHRPTAVQVLGALVGHDPASVTRVPVTEVLEDGYTAAVSEQTQIAATAALPIPPVEEPAQTASTSVMPAADDTGDQGGTPDGGLAALAANRPDGPSPHNGPGTGPTRTTSGLAALVGDTGATEKIAPSGADAAHGGTPAAPPGAAAASGGAARGADAAGGGAAPVHHGSSGGGGHTPPPGAGFPPGGGQRSPRPGRERRTSRALPWILAAGVLLMALAGGWYLIDAFLPSGDRPGVTPVDGSEVLESGPQDGGPATSPTEVDNETAPDSGEETYAPTSPPDGQHTHPPTSPHHDPTSEETWTPDPGWEEDDTEPTDEPDETEDAGPTAPVGGSGVGSAGESGGSGRIGSVSPTAG